MKTFSCRWRRQFIIYLLLITVLLYILIGVFLASKFPKEETKRDNQLNFKDIDSLKFMKLKDFDFRAERVKNQSHKSQDKVIPLKSHINITNEFGVGKISSVLESTLSYNVHIFYYPWYGNPLIDGKYYHWNHPYLPHWNKEEAAKYETGIHSPPDDIGSNFYPQIGPYSSKDPDVITKHMAQMHKAGVGVCVVSWYPPGLADNEGNEPDSLIPILLKTAALYKIKIAFHIEPYKDRSPKNWRENIKYILDRYGNHKSFYRHYDKIKKKHLPVYYIYDSYQTSADSWAQIFQAQGSLSVRNTELDGIFIGLLVERQHKGDLVKAGFDGFYTYFATDRFTYGSTWGHWREITKFAKDRNKIFIPSIGPGYIDTRIRPWNAKNIRNRDNGTYYMSAAKFARDVRPDFLSITSFNEWHEGTQIEPAVRKKLDDKIYYLDYGLQGPYYYLTLTKQIVDLFIATMKPV